MNNKFSVIVIGAGHAGCEAALASARMGYKTLLSTINMDTIGLMPCNPSIGGPGKSHLVYEIDALGGEMARNTEKSYLHIKTLNTSKGPAVRAVRAQIDKSLYSQEMKKTLVETENLTLIQAEISEILVENKTVIGVKTATGIVYLGDKVIITSGTYLRSEIVIGPVKYEGGPHNQMPSVMLSENLTSLGIKLDRYQTATPPRIKKHTIDFSRLKEVESDNPVPEMSFFEKRNEKIKNLNTHVAATNQNTVEKLREGLPFSPLVLKNITDKGPRYCPSIDRKIINFPQKVTHHIFVEPEGFETEEIYLQGLTSATPENIQLKVLRTIEGFENVEIMRPAYGIEYDFIAPGQILKTMELINIKGLYSAGQINGTSGYEEAAAQGIVAGINAVLSLEKKPPFIPNRGESYIGVLIDDLVTKEHYEPYRIFTSSAEYRLILRQDNAVLRLSPYGYKVGLLKKKDFDKVRQYRMKLYIEKRRLKKTYIKNSENSEKIFEKLSQGNIKGKESAYDILKRPNTDFKTLEQLGYNTEASFEIQKILETEIKYEGYILKQKKEVNRLKKIENLKIPENIDYDIIPHISTEAKQNLKKYRPEVFGQIKNMPGISTTELNMIYVWLKK